MVDSETKGLYQQLKKLGNSVVQRVKEQILLCKKNIITASACAIGLTKLIKGLYHDFFVKHKDNPNFIPDFSNSDPFALGKTLGDLTSQSVSDYYDELVRNPDIVKDENAVESFIQSGFKKIDNIYHNSLSRIAYKFVKSIRKISDKDIQDNFNKIF